jgi:hypothetical protein
MDSLPYIFCYDFLINVDWLIYFWICIEGLIQKIKIGKISYYIGDQDYQQMFPNSYNRMPWFQDFLKEAFLDLEIHHYRKIL